MQNLTGVKTYLVGGVIIAYALLAFFHPIAQLPQIKGDEAAQLIFGALALMGIRSGLTTELSKVLAALGVKVDDGAAATPAKVQAQPNTLAKSLKVIATAPGKTAVSVAFAAILFLPFLLGGCSTLGIGGGTVTPADVAKIEIAYTAAANIAANAISTHQLDADTVRTLVELNDAIDHKGDDGQRHGVLIAARHAAMSGDDVTAAAAVEALNQALAALIAYEAAKGLKAP